MKKGGISASLGVVLQCMKRELNMGRIFANGLMRLYHPDTMLKANGKGIETFALYAQVVVLSRNALNTMLFHHVLDDIFCLVPSCLVTFHSFFFFPLSPFFFFGFCREPSFGALAPPASA